MVRLLVGLIFGMVVGSAVAAWSQTASGFYNGTDIMSASRETRIGYAAGAKDMLDTVVAINRTHPLQFSKSWFEKQNACMNEHTGKLGQFTEWASQFWLGDNRQAASTLLDNACP
jgi:hypothetical protein